MTKAAVLSPTFYDLTKGVADGKWVALSSDGTRLISEGDTLNEARGLAKELRELDPILFRINRSTMFL